MIMGTPNYMAPEQARGEKVDARADVYALGAIMYRMLTGIRAFEGTDAGSVITAVLSEEPKRPRSVEPSIPEALEVVVQKAMAKDKSERYQSMEELDRDLSVFDTAGTLSLMPPPMAGVTVTPGGAKTDDRAPTFLGDKGAPAPAASAVVEKRQTQRLRELDKLESAGRDAKLARPTVVLLTPVASAWILGLVVAAAAGTIRAIGNREVTETEVLLMSLFSMAAGITPLIVWIVHVTKNVWRNSVRAMELAADMRRFLAGSLIAYGLAAVTVRFLYSVPFRLSALVASGWWDLGFLFVALLGGAFGGGIGPLARLRRRLLNA